jgi:hypothetical protein
MRRALLFITTIQLFAAQPWHMAGRVVDENGRPVSGAFLHDPAMAETEYFEHYTNVEGRFDIWSDSPMITLKRPGYRSIVLRPVDANKHELRMVKEAKQQRSKVPSTASASHR